MGVIDGGVQELAAALRSASPVPGHEGQVELSVVMPCLNEAETLARCIEKAHRAFVDLGITGEVVIGDNGSTDGSQEIATRLGARVVPIEARGYGNALHGAITGARGRYVIMGDSDDSYDFSAISIRPFIDKLREGYDLVMGNRFRGGIMPGAMPLKHQYLGNPVLSGIGRLFFDCPVGDFHCGLRAFSSNAYAQMDLQTTGMEFASEMTIKATLLRQRIAEVPTILYKDGRSRPPHMRSWRDGWRHLRFMLMFSPRWLFLYPGLILFVTGVAGTAFLVAGPLRVGSVAFDIASLLVASFLAILGYQFVLFAFFIKVFVIVEGFHSKNTSLTHPYFRFFTLETGVTMGLALALAGAALLGRAVLGWERTGFGELDPQSVMRQVILAVLLMATGAQTMFGSFLLSTLTLGRRRLGAR
jgi:glycosyltransferase involved in cell wall biosynthesis